MLLCVAASCRWQSICAGSSISQVIPLIIDQLVSVKFVHQCDTSNFSRYPCSFPNHLDKNSANNLTLIGSSSMIKIQFLLTLLIIYTILERRILNSRLSRPTIGWDLDLPQFTNYCFIPVRNFIAYVYPELVSDNKPKMLLQNSALGISKVTQFHSLGDTSLTQ